MTDTNHLERARAIAAQLDAEAQAGDMSNADLLALARLHLDLYELEHFEEAREEAEREDPPLYEYHFDTGKVGRAGDVYDPLRAVFDDAMAHTITPRAPSWPSAPRADTGTDSEGARDA